MKYNFQIGDKFGAWTIIGPVEIEKGHRKHLCRCICGFESKLSCSNFGISKSTQCRHCSAKKNANKIKSAKSPQLSFSL
jgi:hypothetical protein